MNRTLRFATLALLVAFAGSALAGPEGQVDPDAKSVVAWTTSYGAACESAEKDGKPLLFKFYTGWCPHCVRMDKTTWVDEAVGQLAERFVAAKVNADVEKVPVKRYRLTGYPTVILAEPGGEEVLRLEGYKSPKVLQAYMKAYLENATGIASAFDRLRADRKNGDANVDLGDFYASVGLHELAVERYEKALKSAEGDTWLRASIGAGSSLVHTEGFKAAVKYLRPALERAGDAAPASLLLNAGLAEIGVGDGSAARSTLERVLSRYPDSDEAARAREALATL